MPMKPLGNAGSVWRSTGRATLSVVFVHGFIGDHLKTWSYQDRSKLLRRPKGPPVRFAELLADDPELPQCHYFSVAHEAGITSKTGLPEAAGLVRTFVRDYVDGDEPIVFVAHSFGGLACRRAILDMIKVGEGERTHGLLMLGTPNSGTQIALAAKALGSSSGGDMTPFNADLADLNREWTERVVNEGDPSVPSDHRAQLLCWSVIGTEDHVVTPASAAALASFSTIETLNKDHTGLCKPRDRADHSYRVVHRFIRATVDEIPKREGKRAVRNLTHRLRQASLAGRWVSTEEEDIKLEHHVGSRLLCTVRNVREGGLARRYFNFCVWLPGHYPTDEQVDYDWEVGQGILDPEEFADVSAFHGDRFDDFFKVHSLSIGQLGKAGSYTEVDRKEKPGSVIVTYEAPQWIAESETYDRLEIAFESWLDRRAGWYFYGAPRTVARNLRVTFTSPFEARAINNLGAKSTVHATIQVGDSFLHRVTAEGSVAMGTNIIWVFPAGREHDE